MKTNHCNAMGHELEPFEGMCRGATCGIREEMERKQLLLDGDVGMDEKPSWNPP